MDGNGRVFDYHGPNHSGAFFQPVPLFQALQSPYRYEPEPAPQFPGPQILVPPTILFYWNYLDKMLSEATEDEHAELQKLSNEYIPEITGPLIGPRTSTSAIAEEFANADAYQLKVQSAGLGKEYHSYRRSRGDGNCGWRAIGFGWMELLVRLGDKQKFFEEIARLQSLNNLLNEMNYEESVYEDFVSATTELLRDLANSVDPVSLLLERFNDSEISNAIIVHLRMITSVWMRKYAEAYQPYLADQTVEGYCSTQIDPFQQEIEYHGINALLDVLIKPAGFALEIINLDRSAGERVNIHRFEATDGAGTPLYDNPPTIRLLLRPGHYDMIYKAEDVQPLAPTQSVPAAVDVRLAHRFPAVDNWSQHERSVLLPDMSFETEHEPDVFYPVNDADVPGSNASIFPYDTSYLDVVGFAPPMPISSLGHGLPAAAPQLTSGYQDPLSSMMKPTRSSAYQHPGNSVMSSRPAVPESAGSLGPIVTPTYSTGPFRPSTYQFEATNAGQDPPQTKPMIESLPFLQTHHHQNDNFQPWLWNPGEEKEGGSKASRLRQRQSRR